MTFALTLTPAVSVQLYWRSWDRLLDPMNRLRVLCKRFLGSGNSFKRSGLGLSKEPKQNKVTHTERLYFIPTLIFSKVEKTKQKHMFSQEGCMSLRFEAGCHLLCRVAN